MKLNKKYKYWEFYYDEDGNKNNGTYDETDETDRQNLASLWSDEWHGVREVYNMSDDELKAMLIEDLEYYNLGKLNDDLIKYQGESFEFEPVSKRVINYAIKELKKIKEEILIEVCTK